MFAVAPAKAVVLAMSGVALTLAPVARDAVQLPMWVELFTVVTASAAGTITARAYRLDLVGAITLAIVTGLSGGLLRDIIMQVGDVYILKQPLALPLSCLTALILFMVPLRGKHVDLALQVIDVFNVGLYSAVGVDKAWAYGFSVPACLLMGMLTGVGGGLLRDICLSERPSLFNVGGNLYALTALIGSFAYAGVRAFTDWGPNWGTFWCVVVTMALRWLSVRFDIKSPGPMDLPGSLTRSIHDYRADRRWKCNDERMSEAAEEMRAGARLGGRRRFGLKGGSLPFRKPGSKL